MKSDSNITNLKVLNFFQFLNWILVFGGVSYSIFFLDSGIWFAILGMGLIIQTIILVMQWVMSSRSKLLWLIYNLVNLIQIVFVFLDTNDFIKTTIFTGETGVALVMMFILFSNLLFFLSIVFIWMERKRIRK